MNTPYHVIPVNGSFTIQCKNNKFVIDNDFKALEQLEFSELLDICDKLEISSRMRYNRTSIVSEIKKIIVLG